MLILLFMMSLTNGITYYNFMKDILWFTDYDS